MASRSNKTMRYAMPMKASSAPKTPPAMNFERQVKPMPYATGTDRNGNRLGPRPQVGEADAATRRAALDAALRPGPPVKQQPAQVQPDVDNGPLAGSGGRARSRKIDELVTKMQ